MTEKPSNVINFPNSTTGDLSHIIDIETAVGEAEIAKSYYAELIADDLMGLILAKCEIAGYRVLESESNVRDAVMISESIKSMLLRSMGIGHPLQEFVDSEIDLDDIPESRIPVSDFDVDD